MAAQNKKVFLIGPGYVGREIIDRLRAEGYWLTTLARRDEAIEEFQEDGIAAVKGDLNDAAVISDLASKHDIIFHTATADHLPSAQAILEGVKLRASQGLDTIYLHQSGASFVSDNAQNDFKSDKVYSDSKPEELDALPDSASHRKIDLALLEVRKELQEKAKIFIMMPPIIYGANPKYGRLSIQVPTLARYARKHKAPGVIGKGLAVWGVVHVFDLADAYMTILHWLKQSPSAVALEHPYFFCESAEFSWGEIATMIGNQMRKVNLVEDETPRHIPKEKYSDIFGDFTPLIIASNARTRAARLRSLGWSPKQPTLAEAFANEEVPILQNDKGEFAGYGAAVAS